MKQGIQTNYPEQVLKAEGCYFFCLMRWAEVIRGKEFISSREINFLFDLSKQLEYCKKDATILFPHSILNLAIPDKKFTQIERTVTPPAGLGQYILFMTKPNYNHFLFYNNGQTWDPLDPERPAAKDYKVESYRVIR